MRRARSSRRILATLAALVLVVCSPRLVRAQTPRYVALVVGNSAYQYWDALKNAQNDARLISQTLQKLGFTLVDGKALVNLDRPGFERALQDFGKASAGADVALFYYAGHGLQVGGTNYLVPTEANPIKPSDLDVQMVSASLALQEMEDSKVRLKVMILDACRDNPYVHKAGGNGRGGAAGGLARMDAPEGTVISFSTQPDNVAQDGAGSDSPYAAALAATIPLAGLDIFQMFNRVGVQVSGETQKAQQPWFSAAPLDGDFYFAGAAQTTPNRDPQNAALHFKRGSDLYTGGNLIDAALEYRTAAGLDPTDASPHFGLGLIYEDEKNFGAALKEYQAAVTLDPKYSYAHNGIGNVYYLNKNYAGAVAEYLAAIKFDPKDVFAINNLGNTYRLQKKLDAALAEYREAARIDPTYSSPHNGIGNIYYDADKYDEAIAEYTIAAKLKKTDATSHDGLGNSYFMKKNIDTAVAEYRTAISLDPKNAYPHNGLGYVYESLNNFDAAMTEYRTAIGLDPTFPGPHLRLAALYRRQGKTDEAAAEERLAAGL